MNSELWKEKKSTMHFLNATVKMNKKFLVYIVINLAIGLAERSANCLEAKIKTYWYINKHMARNSSFAENSTDCLKVLNILSLQSIRKFNPTEKVKKLKMNMNQIW